MAVVVRMVVVAEAEVVPVGRPCWFVCTVGLVVIAGAARFPTMAAVEVMAVTSRRIHAHDDSLEGVEAAEFCW